jgi:sugar/nucleoside kinase (ribokinase family)
MTRRTLRLGEDAPFRRLLGVGGIGTGMFLALEGDRTLGRNESRPARLIDARDYCKLHIVEHYVAVLLGARPSGDPFLVVAVGAVGDDEPGQRLLHEMAGAGIDATHVAVEPRPTLFSVCFQYPDGEGGNITTVDSAAASLGPGEVDAVRPLLDGGATIALAAPEVPLDARARLLELATEAGAYRVASFTSSELSEARAVSLLEEIDLASLNEDEASVVTGCAFDPGDPAPFLQRVASALPEARIVLSAGGSGAFAYADARWRRRAAFRVPAVSTAGAGDALLAGVLAGLAAGIPLIDDHAPDNPEATTLTSALDLGVLLAAFSVTSPHTIHPDADLSALLELAERLDLSMGGPLAEVI